jgi:hypothetical protein
VKTWSFVLAALWGAFWAADASVEKWNPLGCKVWWDAHTTHLPTHWEVWFIAMLLLVILGFMEGSFRHYTSTQLLHAGVLASRDKIIGDANAQIAQLMSPADRPRLVFERWGPIPADHPVAMGTTLRTGEGIPVVLYLQNGFHFINDGGPAYKVQVETFALGVFKAYSAPVTRIGEEGGFALVWVEQLKPMNFAHKLDKWDLRGAMAAVGEEENKADFFAQDYAVKVSVVYEDGNGIWYRSRANLAYIPSQRRLEFRDVSHDKGSPTRPS